MPAVTYGGPDVPADKPSPESVKIAESGVLIEFLADLYPGLLPSDPVERAKARFFIETVSSKFSPGFGALFMRGEGPDALFAGLEAVQALLPKEGFAIGQWSIADAAIQPFLGRIELLLRNDVGKFAEGEGPKLYKEIFENDKFARVAKYIKELLARDSWKVTWDEVRISFVLRSALPVPTTDALQPASPGIRLGAPASSLWPLVNRHMKCILLRWVN